MKEILERIVDESFVYFLAKSMVSCRALLVPISRDGMEVRRRPGRGGRRLAGAWRRSSKAKMGNLRKVISIYVSMSD